MLFAKNSRVTRLPVASAATALAPFSQNSKVDACSLSGHAQPGQSKPSGWFCAKKVRYFVPGTRSFSNETATCLSAPQPAAACV